MTQINNFKKSLEKKTFLNASNILLASLIVVVTIFVTWFSISESSCNNEVQIMLTNKTQQYVESQEILFDRGIDASSRAAYIALQNQKGIEAYGDQVVDGSKEYKIVMDLLKEYDSVIDNKKKSCSSLNTWRNICMLILIFLAVIQLLISIKYFCRYLNEKS